LNLPADFLICSHIANVNFGATTQSWCIVIYRRISSCIWVTTCSIQYHCLYHRLWWGKFCIGFFIDR
jgi:hypothetical protein